MRHRVQGCMQAANRGFPQFLIYRCLPVFALSVLTQTAFPQTPPPRIDSVEPNQATPGTTVPIKVHGANFTPRIKLQIEGCAVQNSAVVTQELLQAQVTIPPNTQPGYKRVVLWPYPVFGRFEIIQPNSPEPIVIPRPPERAPDLKVSLDRSEPKNGHLIISASVKNVGDAPSHNAILRAEADTWDKRRTWWKGAENVPPIKAGQSRTFYFEPPIPPDQYGKQTHLVLQVDASQVVKDISIPTPPVSLLWFYAVGGFAAIAGVFLRIMHVRKRKRRNKWQKNANDKKPQLPCRECERYCQKQRIESKAKVTLALYRVDEILIIPHEPESDREGPKALAEEETVDQLNQAITARRLGEGLDNIRERAARIAPMILHTIDETLNAKTSSKDVAIVVRLTGGEVEFEFTLYRCKKKGEVNAWEEEDSWKASIEDKRDEPLATLRGLSTTDFSSSNHSFIELTKQLTEFIREA
jgi:hypothetical protein